MHQRRRLRIAVASGLTAFVASLLWVSGPAAASGGIGVSAKAQYGCSDGGFLVVTLTDTGAPTNGTTYQLGLAPAGPDVPTSFPSDGGPTTVTVGPDPVTVKLAGNPDTSDHIFIQQMDTLNYTTAAIPSTCRGRVSSVPELAPASIAADVAKSNCQVPGQVGIAATVQNPNSPTSNYQNSTGLSVIPYTVLLVRADSGTLVGNASLSFDEAGTDAVCLNAPAKVSATYEVRAIGVDGNTAKSSIAITASIHPSPSPTPSSPPPSTQPVPNPTPSTVKSTPAPSASHSSQHPTSNPAPPAVSSTQVFPVIAENPQLSSAAAGPSVSPSATHALPVQPSPPASASSAVPVPSATGTPGPRTLHLADPPLDNSSRIFLWQRDAALIVLLDALAVAGLVGGVVWSSKRR